MCYLPNPSTPSAASECSPSPDAAPAMSSECNPNTPNPAPHSESQSQSPAPSSFHPDSPERMVEIARELAAELGRKPTASQLRAKGVRCTPCQIHFGGTNGLLRSIGFATPVRGTRARAQLRKSLLKDFACAVERLGRLPSRDEYLEHARFTSNAFTAEFGNWRSVLAAYQKAQGKITPLKPKRSAVLESPPVPPTPDLTLSLAPPPAPTPDSSATVYGRPLGYRAMLHEPTNEQGVVLLFGMMAEKLGFAIENVRTAFPDCEAKRQITPEIWQRVRIEFEFASSRFNHKSSGCDLVVCWKHDDPLCPVPVLDLESHID